MIFAVITFFSGATVIERHSSAEPFPSVEACTAAITSDWAELERIRRGIEARIRRPVSMSATCFRPGREA